MHKYVTLILGGRYTSADVPADTCVTDIKEAVVFMSPAYKRPAHHDDTVKKTWYRMVTVRAGGNTHRVRVPEREADAFWWLYKDLERRFGSEFHILWLSDPFRVVAAGNPVVGMAMARAMAARARG